MPFSLSFIQAPFVDKIKLDIVGLLAILGESAVAKASEVSSLTYAGFLPRLLPAPQALLRVSRQDRLRTTPAKVIGIHSGNIRDVLGLIPRLMLNPKLQDADQNLVQCLKIWKKPGRELSVQACKWGYVTWLAIGSCVGWLALLGLTFWLRDGMALLALSLLGGVSMTTHILLFHKIELPRWDPTRNKDDLPRGDIVICHPKGTFQIIECEEEIARRIFLKPETCEYLIKSEKVYRFLAMPATIALMLGAICLSNSQAKLQFFFAASLIALNAAHWFVAAQREEIHWDWSSIEVKQTEQWHTNNYLSSLWTVIATTGSTNWVKAAKIAPDNQAWIEWIAEAEAEVQKQLADGKRPVIVNGSMKEPAWDPQTSLTRALRRLKKASDKVKFQLPEVSTETAASPPRQSDASEDSHIPQKPEAAELR